MLTGATGISEAEEGEPAGSAAAAAARDRLAGAAEGRAPELVVVFTTARYDQAAVLRGVREVFSNSTVLGCCSAGILTDAGLASHGVGVWALSGLAAPVVAHSEGRLKEEPVVLGERLAAAIEPELAAAGGDATVLVFADLVWGVESIDPALSTFLAALGPGARVVGAGGGDDLKWNESHVFHNERALTNSFVAATVRTPAPVGVGVGHGCTPSSRTMLVTRSERNTIEELDGKPALTRYREAFPDEVVRVDDFVSHGLQHPIGIIQLGAEHLLRTPIRAIGESIACAGNIPERSTVCFMRHDFETLLEAARKAARDALAEIGDRPLAACLLIDCVTRGLLLGDRAARQVEAVREIIGADVPLLGMSSYGEIGAGQGPTQFHNQSLIVYLLAAA